MSRQHETNPHFVRPSQVAGPDQDHYHTPTSPWFQEPRHHGRHSGQPGHRHKRHHRTDKPDHSTSSRHHPGSVKLAQIPVDRDDRPHEPLHPHHRETYQEPHGEPVRPPPHHEDHPKPHVSVPLAQDQDQQRPGPHGSPAPFERHQGDHFPWRRGRQEVEDGNIRMPRSRKNNSLVWFGTVFCAFFWVVVILGGLIVLIVYLVFRPRSPRFDVSTATLNAAYLDMGYLLNADLTVLANFTNPNKKVSVDFSYMYIELYYGRTLIATQSIEPFTAPKVASKFENLHMVTSQVRLSELEIQRFKRQLMNNGVMFEVKGFFRARSKFGGLLRYSYWLHGRCIIMVTRPPDGVMVAKKCKSRH